uniref:G-protein coupled receptors family 1 profile domain-containing protein n=1 Tax=Musca domestica TaxID=7370 RepID=A0A1I8MS13_MUSDO
MSQDIPLHVAMITHILIAWDRMRWLANPVKGRFPAFVCCCATWLTGMVIALPYPIYTIYVEIGDFLPRLHGIGLCVVNLMDDMHEYVRGLFFLMYCAPTVLLSYLYIRTSQELRPPDEPLAVMLYEQRAEIRMRQRNSSASSVERSYSGATTATIGGGSGTATRSYDLYSAEWDVNREKRNQRNFGSMAAAQVVCLCPLMILRFARLSMEETYENQKHFDFTYLMFVWIAFLPTVIFPCIYASQILPREEQERLRGYFRLSNKRLPHKSHANGNGCLDANGRGGGGGGSRGGRNGRSGNPSDNSIEKDENTNTTQATTSIILNGEPYVSGQCGTGSPGQNILGSTVEAMSSQKPENIKTLANGKYQHQNSLNKDAMAPQLTARIPPPRQRNKDGGKSLKHSDATFGNDSNNAVHENSKKYKRTKDVVAQQQQHSSDVRINVISDGKAKTAASRRGGSIVSAQSNGPSTGLGGQRKLTLESLDNRSCSNITASTYCNGNSSLGDDGDVSSFGDGDGDSSIVSGMIVQGSSNGSSNALPPYYDKKPSGMSLYSSIMGGMRTRDMSFDDGSSTFSRIDSSSTLAREMEIIDMLERERSSIDMQELLQRDSHNESQKRRDGERRRLPDIGKICPRSPKPKRDSYSYEKSNNTSITSLSAKVPTSTDPLRTNNDGYSLSSGLNEDDGDSSHMLPYDDEHLRSTKSSQRCSIDEEVPSDFFDSYTPGDTTAILPSSAPAVSGAVQYQYSRRLSRKSSSHHNPGSATSHRMSKRDSFNSLHSNDLIAGAFGELDPTQPLTKMSVIENRMVRRSGSSGRTSSFSSSARSSMKSRDYGHGSSSHSTHPELDFRENFLADL